MFKNPYLDLFQKKETFLFSFFGLIARMSMVMIPTGILALQNQIGANFSKSSFLMAINVLTNASFSLYLSRLADRYGQSKVLLISSLVTAFFCIAFIFAAFNDEPLWILAICAIGSGFLPHFGAFVRARWTHLYKNTDKLQTAFALESILDEIIYIISPVVIFFLAATISPAAGTILSVILLLFGSFVFITLKSTEPKPQLEHRIDKSSVIIMPEMFLLVLILFFLGFSYGAVQVCPVAYAKELNQASLAGTPIAAYSIGSLVAGTLYGLKKWKIPLSRQFFYLTIIDFLFSLPIYFAFDMYSLSFLLFLAGMASAPSIIVSISLVQKLIPQYKITEGIGWISTGMIIGSAVGSALAGQIIDYYGAKTSFLIITFGAICVVITGILSANKLSQIKQ